MTYKPPYQDNPMIPPIARREQMEQHVEDIITALCFEIMKFESSEYPLKKEAYRKLTKKGFQNEDFKQLAQTAVDYFDYQLYGHNKRLENIVDIDVIKLVELYLAQLLKTTGQTSTMLPGALNRYRALQDEYPELKRRIHEHLSKCGNNLGASKMSNYPVQYNDGNWYVTDAYGRLMQVQPPPQTTDEQWNAMQQRRRMNQTRQVAPQQYAPAYHQGYQPTPPPQQWGVNPPPGYQMGTPMTQHRPPNQGYAGYNAAGAPAPSGSTSGQFGPFNDGMVAAPSSQPQNPQASSQQRHIDLPPPTSNGTAVKPTPRPGTAPKTAPAPVAQQPAAPVSEALMKTHSGYECEYFAAQRGVEGLDVGVPIMYDARLKKGIYILTNQKRVKGFKTIPYEDSDMDYNKHETIQFFAKTREEAAGPSRKQTSGMLADIQRKMFVKETLESISYSKLEGNVTGSVGDFDLSKPIIISGPVVSSASDTQYIQRLLEQVPNLDITKQVVNFEHYSTASSIMTEDLADEVLKLRKCKDWFQLKEILNEMVQLGFSLDYWRYYNETITNYINDMLLYRFNIDIKITSFDTDIGDLVSLLHKEFGIRNDFSKGAEELCRTKLYPHNVDDNESYSFADVHNYEIEEGTKTPDDARVEMEPSVNEDGEEEEKALRLIFCQLSDVTILPLESSSIYLPVPEQNAEWSETLPTACAITEDSFPELYRAIEDRVKNANYRASQVVFVTADNKMMHIKQTDTDEVFIISRKP